MSCGNKEQHNHIHCGLCENMQKEDICGSLKPHEFKGAWLAINSIIAFILPLFMAIATSLLLGKSIMARFNGALIGLTLGMMTAFILSKLILRVQKL